MIMQIYIVDMANYHDNTLMLKNANDTYSMKIYTWVYVKMLTILSLGNEIIIVSHFFLLFILSNFSN